MKPFPNKYAADCAECGQRVQVGEGLTSRGDGKWIVTHTVCPQEAPETVVQPAETQTTGITPTAEQMECVKLFATGDDLVIQAGAGAGKTSTLKLLANHALANGRIGWYGAYNRDIVKDVSADMPGNVTCSTMHSLAYAACGAEFAHRLPPKAPRQRATESAAILGLREFNIPGFDGKARTLAAGWLASKVLAAVSKFCHSADTEIGLQHFEYIDGIDEPDKRTGEPTFTNNRRLAKHLLPFAHKAWEDLTDPTGRLRYSHDVYLKVWSLNSPRINADFVLLDEAQDADPVQVEIIKAQRQYGTQVVCVGDEQQVLYEWRGAVDALGMFEEMGARVAFLSQSFRFGDAVAEVANGMLTRLDARMRVRGFGKVASVVGPIATPDAILCRTNAGAVKNMLSLIAEGRKVHLVGGGAEVVSFAKASQALQSGQTTMHPELCIFSTWEEVERYVSEDDQGAELRLMVKLVTDFGPQEIIDALGTASTEQASKENGWDGVVISTAHKSKGRQWASVQIAGDFVPPKKGTGDASPAELRLAYVACTRAKRELDLSNVPHFEPGWTPQS